MLVFHRIFNFDQTAVAHMELRLNTRYTPGATFPLQAWLLVGVNETPAKIRDISGNGIGLRLFEPVAGLAENSPVRVRLRFGAHQQLLAGTVVHLQAEAAGMACGIGLQFADFPERKTYLQLLQPIAIGQSLLPVPEDRVIQNEPQFIKRAYRGDENSLLTVWVEKGPGTLRSFEFQMQDYFCHVDGQSGVLEAYAREDSGSHKGKLSNPVFDISGTIQSEIRQLFRWILPNLAAAVPDDVRAFLQRHAT